MLNKDQQKKSADIFEKLGVTVLIAAIGDMLVSESVINRIIWDILGILWGIILMIMAVLILGDDK